MTKAQDDASVAAHDLVAKEAGSPRIEAMREAERTEFRNELQQIFVEPWHEVIFASPETAKRIYAILALKGTVQPDTKVWTIPYTNIPYRKSDGGETKR